MATQTLTPQTATRAGITPTLNGSLSTSDDYQFANDGMTYMRVVNGGGSASTVTIPLSTLAAVDGRQPAARTVSVPAGETRVIGPFPKAHYNDANGRVTGVTFSFVTSVTVELVSVPASG